MSRGRQHESVLSYKVKPVRNKSRYRNYDSDNMLRAYNHYKNGGVSVRKVAKMFGVPQTTLRDRVDGRIDPEKFARDTLFSREEEEKLINHIQSRAELGYGMTNIETRQVAGEMAHELGRRPKGDPLSKKWLYNFLKRWKEKIASLKPQQLESSRAKNSTPEAVNAYFDNLKAVVEENGLTNKPQFIYNLDETAIQPEHRPSNILANPNYKPHSVTSPKSSTTTLIGCVNALGQTIPPFFVFKGQRWNPELMKGACTGAQGTMSEKGWSNSEVFQNYLENHFLPFARSSSVCSQPILLIYDGHSSHKNPETIRWAREKGVILFVLPAHTSHILQPLDVAIFGPFKKFYYSECAQFMYRHMGRNITKYDICSLACRAYQKAMTPLNIQSGFRKTGVYPLNTKVVSLDKLLPSESFRDVNPIAKVKAIKSQPEFIESFLERREESIIDTAKEEENGKCQKKRVTTRGPNAGGKAITSDEFFLDFTNYLENKHMPKEPSKQSKATSSVGPKSPQPSTSGLCNNQEGISVDSGSDSEDDTDDKCCVCGRFYPPKQDDSVKIISWGQCDSCGHWVHLKICSPVRVVRRHTIFLCPHCARE